MPSDNKRFGEMAAGLIAQAGVIWETVCDSSSGVQLNRHFAKPPPRYLQVWVTSAQSP